MSNCKGCGKEIIWAKSNNTGKTLPLEKVPAYEIVNSKAVSAGHIFISHFLTCKKANDFSGSKKKQQSFNEGDGSPWP